MVLLVPDIKRLGSSNRAVLLATLADAEERAARGCEVNTFKLACVVFAAELEALSDANRDPTAAGGGEDRNVGRKT